MATTSTDLTRSLDRRYRFGPLDRAGILLGLAPLQGALLGGGLLAAGVLVQARAPIITAVAIACVAGVGAFGRWRGRQAYEWLEPVVSWSRLLVRGQHRWHTTVRTRATSRVPALPPFLAGLAMGEVPHPGGAGRADGVAIISDRHLVAATLRVQGRDFALLEPPDQARVLDSWGESLAAFCRERSPISRVGWCEWSAPGSLDEHLTYVARDAASGDDLHAAEYLAMVRSAGPLTTHHDVLVTLSVDRRRIDRRRVARPATNHEADPAIRVLLDELELFARRLDHAGLHVEGLLSAADLARVMRERLDPTCRTRLAARATTLGEAAGVVAPHNWAPAAVAVDWHHVRVDGSWHRCFWITEWPRLEVPADWMAPLVLHSGSVRTLSLIYEPIAPSRSRRTIDRDATRLASDEDQRSRRGFRIRAGHRRAEHEVLAREAELVAGYPELAYTGFVTVTAESCEALDAACDEWEQAAAQVGLELRCLDGQHDLALAASLPIPRVPASRTIAT